MSSIRCLNEMSYGPVPLHIKLTFSESTGSPTDPDHSQNGCSDEMSVMQTSPGNEQTLFIHTRFLPSWTTLYISINRPSVISNQHNHNQKPEAFPRADKHFQGYKSFSSLQAASRCFQRNLKASSVLNLTNMIDFCHPPQVSKQPCLVSNWLPSIFNLI